MPQIVSRQDTQIPLVADATDKSLLPAFQATSSLGNLEFYTVPIQPAPPTNTFSNGSTLYFDLEPREVTEISNIIVRLKLSCTTQDVQLVPAPYMFDRILVEDSHGSGPEVARIYPETIIAYDILTNNDEAQQKCAEMGNYSLTEITSRNVRKLYSGESNYIRAGQTKEIYLTLPLPWIRFHALDFGHIANDLRFRFEASNDVVVSGSASNISLDSFDFLIQCHKDHPEDRAKKLSKRKKHRHSYIWLEPERLQVNTKTLTANAKTEIFLDQFAGKVPFLMVVIKGSTTPQASDKTKYDFYEIGTYGNFDVENSSGKSLIMNGSSMNQNQCYNFIQDQIGTKPIAGVYFIPFCEDIKKSVAGNVNSFRQFYGQKDKLCINFDTAPTQEEHSIDIAAAATFGTYKYAFGNGIIDTIDVDYDDSIGDLLTAINNIPQLALKGITATSVNNNLASGTTQTITWSSRSGCVEKEVGKLTVVGNGIPKVTGSTVSTYGNDGWTTGSNYQVEVFAFKFVKLKVDTMGRLDREEL